MGAGVEIFKNQEKVILMVFRDIEDPKQITKGVKIFLMPMQ